jgi:hypothetical protein
MQSRHASDIRHGAWKKLPRMITGVCDYALKAAARGTVA